MKAIMVMYDSLNRHMLPPYGSDEIIAPNFKRLQERAVTFDNCYVGSMPCMPTRREIHTGRHNFLHTSWGPIEPYDDSMPEILKRNGIHSHLVTDHHHYWEEGGANYHTRYSTFEFVRGQENDPWKGHIKKPDLSHTVDNRAQDWINRSYMSNVEDHSQMKTFDLGLEFIETNHDEDNWFLQLEAFDPHEPFFSNEKYNKLYPDNYDGLHFDWPGYSEIKESEDVVEHVKNTYKALVTMCDENLGRVLDMMDKYNMWEDTMLIVNTDHGFLFGEHNWWAKTNPPLWNEIAHTPLFIWDPRSGRKNERCDSLVQSTDLAPTILEYFNIDRPKDMQGKVLRDAIAKNAKVRDYAIFGFFGMHVNCTDGRYMYMRAAVTEDNGPLYDYTLMPMSMTHTFHVSNFQNLEVQPPFDFTKGCYTMKIPSNAGRRHLEFGTLLYDLKNDPKEQHSLDDKALEEKMIKEMVRLMKETDAPVEQYERLGLQEYL